MNGYSRVASLMAAHTEVAIVRGFKSAYALDVLYHQAELLHLMQDWAEIVALDRSSTDTVRQKFDTYFIELGMPEVSKEHSAQWLKWREIRQKLKEYRTSISTLRAVINEPKPDSVDIETFRTWLKVPDGGGDFLDGSEAETWQEGEEDDFVALLRPAEKDMLSRWLTGPVTSWVHDHITDRFKKEVELRDPFLSPTPLATPLKKYPDPMFEAIVASITTVLASLFPAMSIFALVYVQNQTVRLGMIVAFCTLFSVVLMVATTARRIDCFAATAAFAAVQVVFVGQQGSVCTC